MSRFVVPLAIFFALISLCSMPNASANAVRVSSPDQQTKVVLDLVDGMPVWQVQTRGTTILDNSPLRIFRGKSKQPCHAFASSTVSESQHDSTWHPTWGQTSSVRNHYREVAWELTDSENPKNDVTIQVRVFDDSVAIRYVPVDSSIKIGDETGLNFGGDFTFWCANGERANLGPLKLSQWGAERLQAPMTFQVSDDLFGSVLEAAIYDQYPFSISKSKVSDRKLPSFRTRTGVASVAKSGLTSWRVLLFGRNAGDLITNQTLVNLNPECEIEDTSWIKPGLAMWDWRAWGATAPDGFQYGLDMESWRRMIDFAASKENVRYLLLDANWYGPEFDPKSNPTTSRDHLVSQTEAGAVVRSPAPEDWSDPIDVPAIIQYGKERGVGVILYFNDHARKNFDFETTLALYEQWGAAGIKYGFMATSGDAKTLQTRHIVEMCAKHKLICDFHDGPIPGSGDVRTYPNYLAREFCHAQADAKRSFTPETFCTTVFVNMLTGPLDMNNGLYAIQNAEVDRPRIFNKVFTTVVAETARVMIVDSGLAIIPDIPEAYEERADLFAFLEALPMTWDETRVLNAKVGDHITIARRSGKQWFVASACDENGAELPIDLSFLDAETQYEATLFADTAETHYKSNPQSYQVTTQTVTRDDRNTAKLAAGGGHCMLIKPIAK
ncbi:alpha-glucosidase [Neorhodopirellula lusitana]|uniref:Alpha-glucosidase n=1 Tax=Neorhodopirellula lusitana TaxID=445327 RepID=A0ABY1QRX1_9BACT|nr:glycoside hydrolase family 97 protein [Neorhodopirellula lusitana]SMP75922.1 alpha-glucosidase [Neorhodopirellula lusitana]